MSGLSVTPADSVVKESVPMTEIVSRKTAICAVSMGEAIMSKLVGKEISDISSDNKEELFSAIINNELKLS